MVRPGGGQGFVHTGSCDTDLSLGAGRIAGVVFCFAGPGVCRADLARGTESGTRNLGRVHVGQGPVVAGRGVCTGCLGHHELARKGAVCIVQAGDHEKDGGLVGVVEQDVAVPDLLVVGGRHVDVVDGPVSGKALGVFERGPVLVEIGDACLAVAAQRDGRVFAHVVTLEQDALAKSARVGLDRAVPGHAVHWLWHESVFSFRHQVQIAPGVVVAGHEHGSVSRSDAQVAPKVAWLGNAGHLAFTGDRQGLAVLVQGHGLGAHQALPGFTLGRRVCA